MRRSSSRPRRLVLALAAVVAAIAIGLVLATGLSGSAGKDGGATRAARPAPPAAGTGGPIIDPGTAPVAGAFSPDGTRLPRVRALGPSPQHVRLGQKLRAGLAFDLATGRVLWSRDAHRVLPIASLTKLMTALLVVERTRPRDIVKIPRAATRVSGSRMGYLKTGRSVRVETLLQGLLMSSGNDAAVALAVHVAGSERRFVQMMNDRARRLALVCTHYSNPYGLGTANHSCPEDLAQLAIRALAQPRIARIARRRSAKVRIGRIGLRWLATTNPLLRQRYPGTIGLKTGFTDPAGRCLVAAVRRGGRVTVVVVLHSDDPATAVRRVLAAVV
jgi:serine-type D-Ala-D-Ala carboxypeptidase (penicillin-binding protein 5/6)